MNGVSRGRRAAPVVLSEQERLSLQSIVRNNRTPKGVARRCRAILRFADGLGNAAVAAELGVSDATVSVWRRNAVEHGIMRRPGGPWTNRGHRLSAETTTEVAHWVRGIKGTPVDRSCSGRRRAVDSGAQRSKSRRFWHICSSLQGDLVLRRWLVKPGGWERIRSVQCNCSSVAPKIS